MGFEKQKERLNHRFWWLFWAFLAGTTVLGGGLFRIIYSIESKPAVGWEAYFEKKFDEIMIEREEIEDRLEKLEQKGGS